MYVSNTAPCTVAGCNGTETQISCRSCGQYVRHYCTGGCGSSGGSFAHEQNCPSTVSCSSCSGKGKSACSHGYRTSHTVSNGKTCTSCNGSGKRVMIVKCSHGKTSSHTYSVSCSNCSGKGGYYDTTTCSHGYTSSHTVSYSSTCSTCSGNGTVTKSSPCTHGYTSAHTVRNGKSCTTCSGSGAITAPCEHGYTTKHEFCAAHNLNYAHIELFAKWN